MKNKKKTVLLRAPLLSESGYGVHARQIARWLFDKADATGSLDITTELLNWGNTPWLVDVYAHDNLIGRCFQASAYPKEKYDITIQLQLPNEWCPELGNYNIGITAGVEADRCNPEWIAKVNSMTKVIVPSEFTKTCFTNTGGNTITTPIEVVPESFFDMALKQDEIPSLEIEGVNTKFNFLVFGQATGGDALTDRKNLPFTVKWLFEVFHDKPDVGVILKTNLGRMSQADKHLCRNMMSNLADQVNKQVNPKFYLLHGAMTEEEMVGLYKNDTVKAIVSTSHGEGFGLPLLEAAACGVPVISTNWSAPTEFLGIGKYIPIDYTMVEIPPTRVDGQIWVKGQAWALADEQDFKKRVMRFYEDSSKPRQWAKDLKAKLLKKYNYETIAKNYDTAIGDVLK